MSNRVLPCRSLGNRICETVLVLALVLPAVGSSAGQPFPGTTLDKPDFAKAREFIRSYMTERSIPSIAVSVVRRGEILWEEGFGLADRENRIPATEHTLYYMASVSKSMTATALMILRERGQLDLDRPINEYLGAAKLTSPAWNPTEATVRRVANHTAGLTTFNLRNHLSIDETIRRYGVLFWPPGEQFDYSNLGYKILDAVVARQSGRSHGEFLRTEVFEPLGMSNACVGLPPGLEKQKNVAQRYSVTRGLQPHVEDGVYCSAHDLARFGMFCLKTHRADQKQILTDASIDLMHNSVVAMDQGKTQYSLSWTIDTNLYGYHGILAQGGTSSAQAWLRLIPSEGIAVVALANNGAMSSQVIHEILSALLPLYGEKRAKAEAEKKSPAPEKDIEKAPPAPALVGDWKGFIKTYRAEIPLKFSISRSGTIQAMLGHQPATNLTDVKFVQGQVRGQMPGNLGVDEDTGPEPYHLELYLSARGENALKGAVVTGPSPGLPFWAELKKQRPEGAK